MSIENMDLHRNKLLVGDYQIIKRLGEGSFGAVFLAKHVDTKQQVAIKMIAVRTNKHETATERESVLLQSLQTSDPTEIIQIIEVIRLRPCESPVPLSSFPASSAEAGLEVKAIVCLVMEYFEGQELLEYLQRKNFLKEEIAAKIFRQLLQALHYIHKRGIVHRDLKLENLLINSKKEIKLIDFGLSQYLDDHTKLSSCVGSAVYCAPEVFQGSGYDGFKADIWSCGVILYSMVSGEFPWEHPDTTDQLVQMNSGTWMSPLASPLCAEFIDCMMQVNPDNRLSIPELLQHPWLKKYCEPTKFKESHPKLCSFVEVIKSHTPFMSIHA